MTYGQLNYYHKNKDKILEKKKLKRDEESNLNKIFKVNTNYVGRAGHKWKGEKIKKMKIKKGEFKILFD